MFELWGRKRPVDGIGHAYEFIFRFDNEEYKYTAMDSLDRNVYQEGLIVNKDNNSCVMYVEFEPLSLEKEEGRRLC